MNTSRLVELSQDALSDKSKITRERKRFLKEIQHKLKKKSKKLKEKIQSEENQDRREQIQKELAIVVAQRQKIIDALKTMK